MSQVLGSPFPRTFCQPSLWWFMVGARCFQRCAWAVGLSSRRLGVEYLPLADPMICLVEGAKFEGLYTITLVLVLSPWYFSIRDPFILLLWIMRCGR